MNPDAFAAAVGMATIINTGILTGIFFKLGGMVVGLSDAVRRIAQIERKLESRE
jgi:hypothetical protein